MQHLLVSARTANSKGFSLIEVLVAVGLMGVLLFVFTSMMLTQKQETRALNEKMAALDIQNTLSKVMADGTLCAKILVSNGSHTFDASVIDETTTPQKTAVITPAINEIPLNIETGAPVFISTTGPNSQPSSLSNSLVVSSIDVVVTKGQPTGNFFLGELRVNFDSTKLVRAIKPLVIKIPLQTSGAPGSKLIVSCSSGNVQTWEASSPLSAQKTLSVAHGMSPPIYYRASLIKKAGSPENGYVIGSEVGIESFWQWPNSYDRPFTITATDTTLSVYSDPTLSGGGSSMNIQSPSGIYTINQSNFSNWYLKITAYGSKSNP